MTNELPEFTKSMKKTHTILLPEMLEFHFGLLKCAFISSGYKMDVLDSDEKTTREYGLKYANNDICYPAVLIIGQMIAALESGKYDPHKVALMIPQAGGSCRAGNYFHLIRKAIVNAGYWFVPVISLNIGGKEKNPGFTITIGLFRAAKAAIFYGDVLQKMYFQTLPYEQNSGESRRLLYRFYDELSQEILHKKYSNKQIYSNCKKIISEFSLIEKCSGKYKKIGVAGELYIKFCNIGNNNIVGLILSQKCEPVMISFSSYAIYVVNGKVDEMRLCGKHFVPYLLKIAQKYLEKCQGKIAEIFSENGAFAIIKYDKIKQNGSGYIGYDCNTGDGWLVAAESVSLIESGCESVIIAHPFGCLVSHVCERGIVPVLRRKYPNISIQAVEYDSGINEVRTTSRVMMGIGRHLENDKNNKNDKGNDE